MPVNKNAGQAWSVWQQNSVVQITQWGCPVTRCGLDKK
jgi:hypothetical protein